MGRRGGGERRGEGLWNMRGVDQEDARGETEAGPSGLGGGQEGWQSTPHLSPPAGPVSLTSEIRPEASSSSALHPSALIQTPASLTAISARAFCLSLASALESCSSFSTQAKLLSPRPMHVSPQFLMALGMKPWPTGPCRLLSTSPPKLT